MAYICPACGTNHSTAGCPVVTPKINGVPILWHAQKMTEMIERYNRLAKERDQLKAELNEKEIALARIFSDAARLTEERDRALEMVKTAHIPLERANAENARLRAELEARANPGGISGGGCHQFGPDIGEDGEIWQK